MGPSWNKDPSHNQADQSSLKSQPNQPSTPTRNTRARSERKSEEERKDTGVNAKREAKPAQEQGQKNKGSSRGSEPKFLARMVADEENHVGSALGTPMDLEMSFAAASGATGLANPTKTQNV